MRGRIARKLEESRAVRDNRLEMTSRLNWPMMGGGSKERGLRES